MFHLTFLSIDCDLEGPAADELRLHGVDEKECHQTRVDLVLQRPADEAWCGTQLHVGPGVEVENDHGDEDHLGHAEELGDLEPEGAGVVILPGDDQVRILVTELLLQHRGELPVHLLVASGVAVLEPYRIPSQLLISDRICFIIFADKL